MPFNSLKNDFQNEDEFVSCMNNKKFCEVDYNFCLFLEDLYGFISDKIKRINIKKGV